MHPSWCCTMLVFTDHAQIAWNYAGDDLWSASCCALLLAESNSNRLKEEQNANKGTLPPFCFSLILMHKDACEDNKKYFLILQMNSFNLDNVLSLLTVLGQFIIFSESVSHHAVCPDVSCTILQKTGIAFMNYLGTGGYVSSGIFMTLEYTYSSIFRHQGGPMLNQASTGSVIRRKQL